MAHLWFSNLEGQWALRPLTDQSALLGLSEAGPVLSVAQDKSQPTEVCLLPLPGVGPDDWIILAGSAAKVRINGQELILGMRALRDRDDIWVAGQHLFFSTERLACVEPFPGAVQPAFCPRCKQELNAGAAAVRCPRCRAWHHQTEEFGCWTYEEHCALCAQQLTALDAGYSWTPEEL